MRQLLIDYEGSAIRSALLKDGILEEIFIDHKERGSKVGHIINAVVKKILPSRFAFVDIGQEKDAFMNLPEVNDKFNETLKLKPGQVIPIQIRKDASGIKGAKASHNLQFKGRYAIVTAGYGEIGVSLKILDKSERKRLQQLAVKLTPSGFHTILRTQADGISDEIISAEVDDLLESYEQVKKAAQYALAKQTLYRPDNILYDLPNIDEIITSEDYKDQDNQGKLFDKFGVERQITKALHRNVWLPCGGFVTFDPVEACVVVDVNTGKFEGKRNYRETVRTTNLEAAKLIAWQIGLRNLSGMIIVDFIDMTDAEDQRRLLTVFGEELKKLRIPADIVGMTSLGLVQLTRRKQREPLHRLLQKTCPECNGSGLVRDRLNST